MASDLRRVVLHRAFLKDEDRDLSTRQSGVAHRARTVAIVARPGGAPDGDRLDGRRRRRTTLSTFGTARRRRALWLADEVAVRPRDNGVRSKAERPVVRDRETPDPSGTALTAIAARMARTAHAVIERGVDDRPFSEGAVPGGRTSL